MEEDRDDFPIEKKISSLKPNQRKKSAENVTDYLETAGRSSYDDPFL